MISLRDDPTFGEHMSELKYVCIAEKLTSNMRLAVEMFSLALRSSRDVAHSINETMAANQTEGILDVFGMEVFLY
jgi:hypothetical protein